MIGQMYRAKMMILAVPADLYDKEVWADGGYAEHYLEDFYPGTLLIEEDRWTQDSDIFTTLRVLEPKAKSGYLGLFVMPYDSNLLENVSPLEQLARVAEEDELHLTEPA